MEHHVPLVADLRVPDVGQPGLAVPQPALVHAEDQSRAGGVCDVPAAGSVYLWHELDGGGVAVEYHGECFVGFQVGVRRCRNN